MPSPNILDLSRGWPAPSLLPAAALLRASQTVLTDPNLFVPALQYGDDAGYELLRIAIAEWLQEFFSTPWTTVGRICISGGASMALACILQVFTDPVYTQNVFLVTPTYFLAFKVFEDNGFTGKLKGVPEDAEGIDIEYLEQCLLAQDIASRNGFSQPPTGISRTPQRKLFRNIIYCVPTFSNPSTKSMSIRRRQQLVQIARDHDSLVIADDVYDHLRWAPHTSSRNESAPPVLPRLVDIDHEMGGGTQRPGADGFGNVVSNGSFSKIIGPGCRTGWTEATDSFTVELSQCGSTLSGGSPSQLTGVIVCQMLKEGALLRQLNEVMIPSLQRRHWLMRIAVQKYLIPQGASMSDSNGGYFIWITLPTPISAKDFTIRAASDEDVIVAPGDIFEVSSDKGGFRFDREIRLCFAWELEEALAVGVKSLGRVLESMLRDCQELEEHAKVTDVEIVDFAPAHFSGNRIRTTHL
ncbi:Uncharacterized protein LHYA1_G005310 [Lachnellula hyalina]|uniref:Aminotransferase class I/classII large domain-containing protein n=1 Tax=Lachnellula hyalina TaxID=1316788 RepID=A0A8H8U075_9HELO|nr:Uncharacterized protein LHYA1_G005310 [Lachnellula hyalina]TVY25751.1 Uncharacterized protein LHYA1_G005310 [Lachnellula hyalina]